MARLLIVNPRIYRWTLGLLLLGGTTAEAQLICQQGQSACIGRYGQSCYSPAQQRCNDGMVCGSAQTACIGPYGRGCYSPSQGQTCNRGLICSTGQQACIRGGTAACYAPARGQTCN